jgi:hypothetical protein
MAQPKFYSISALPKNSKGIGGKLGKFYRKRQLVISVIGVYVMVGGLLGYLLFNSTGDSAKASESALISASVRLVEDKELVIGDKVEVAVTLQNTSITESINNLAIDLFSTKEAVSWVEVTGGNTQGETSKIIGQNNSFKLPVLSSGERAEYIVTGNLQNDQIDYLTILAKVRFLNKDGQQEVNTNRVFTKLKKGADSDKSLVSLALNKDSFAPGEEVFFNLSQPAEGIQTGDKLAGKIYVSKKDSEQISTLNCTFDDQGKCQASIQGLQPGQYTSIFTTDGESFFSNIGSFQIGGQSADFSPSSQSSLDFPFASASINGSVPVIARRVVSLNESVQTGDFCTFLVKEGDTVLTSVKAQVKLDRSCQAVINTSQIPKGDGVYIVQLAGTDLQREVSFAKKLAQYLSLETKNVILQSNSDVELEAKNITDLAGAPLQNKQVTLGIWHQESGEYREVSSVNGQNLSVKDGFFAARVPAEMFRKGGLYSVFMKVEDGQQSDFLVLNFDDKEIGFSGSGVMVDNYDNLKVGQDITLTLQNVMDRTGKTLSEGECAASIYTSGNTASPISIKGQIKDGNCKVFVSSGKITRSGPFLVSFTGPEINSKINQSRQFLISAGAAEKFGEINLEFMPARKGYANNLIVGPITDAYGNLTNSFDNKLQIFSGEELKQEYTNINILSGFTKLALPSTIFENDTLTLKLVDSTGKELITKTVEVKSVDEKLILPNFSDKLSGDKNIQVGIQGLKVENTDKCKLTFVRSSEEFAEQEVAYDKENGRCEFDWNLNQLRNNPKALIRFEVGDYKFAQVVNLESGEAANLFVLAPEVRINEKDEVRMALLTSPFVDRNGLVVNEGKVRIQYNGKAEEVRIVDGLARLDIPANKLDSKDIRSNLDQRFLELGVDARASVSAVAKTNSLSVYLGNKDISNSSEVFAVQLARTQINSKSGQIFKFRTEACEAILLSSNQNSKILKTHKQGDTCYVEVMGDVGDYNLLFTQNGFTVGNFKLTIDNSSQEVIWCQNKNCLLQVLAPVNSRVEATIFDQDKQYKFQGEDLENVVQVKQNGLNPLKTYLVEIKYLNAENKQLSFYKELPGEYLVG